MRALSRTACSTSCASSRDSQSTKPGMGDSVAKNFSLGSSCSRRSITRLSRKLPKLIPRRPGCVFEME
ncbi:Uncharacterised protein [Bordetella pertussis]|nr:Uncharacterised protein [Bordetella pertussis]